MRTRLGSGTVIAVAMLILLCFSAVQVLAVGSTKSAKTAKITLQQLPKAVKDTLLREAKGGKIGQINKTTESGATTYSAGITKAGKTFDVKIDSKGKLIKPQEAKPREETRSSEPKAESKELSARLASADVPAAVRQTIKAFAGSGKMSEVVKVMNNGKPAYSANVTKDGKDYYILVAPDGKKLDSGEPK